MIFRTDDRYYQAVYCDAGPQAGQYRATGYLYGTRAELDALLGSRDAVLHVESAPDTPADAMPEAPDWWPYASEFPDWLIWRGVAGLLYARRPKSSPPKVVHSTTTADLRDQIKRSISESGS